MTEIQVYPQIFQISKRLMCHIMSAELGPRPAVIAERKLLKVEMASV